MAARGLREPPAAKALLIAAAVAYVALMLLLPLGAVLAEAFRKGWQLWLAAISDGDAWASIKLTLLVAAISVPLNTIFGVAAAWAIAGKITRKKVWSRLAPSVSAASSVSLEIPASTGSTVRTTNGRPMKVSATTTPDGL